MQVSLGDLRPDIASAPGIVKRLTIAFDQCPILLAGCVHLFGL